MVSIINLSWLLIGLYTLYFLLFQKKKNVLLFLTIIVLFVPKVNLISIGSISTGIRADDFIIALAFIYILFTRRITANHAVNRFAKLLSLVCLANLCSILFSILFLDNNNLLWAGLVLARKIEYFVLIYVGYFAFSDRPAEERDAVLFRELSVLNCALFLLAFLQMQGLCGYVIQGEARATFSRAAVGTFNGYYEYALFLCFSNIFYFFAFANRKRKVFPALMFLATVAFIYWSSSRTSLLVTLLIDLILIIRWVTHLPVRKAAVAGVSCVLVGVVGLLVVSQRSLISDSRLGSITLEGLWKTLKTNWDNASFEVYLNYFNYDSDIDLHISTGGDLSAAARFYKWGAVFKQFLKYPLLGYGFGVSNVVDGNYIRLLGETGIIGTFLWLYLLFSVLKFERKATDRMAPVCVFATVALLLNSILIDSFESSKNMEFYWFLIGCSVRCNRGIKSETGLEGTDTNNLIDSSSLPS